MDNCCCGFGHRNSQFNFIDELQIIIKQLILTDNINVFLTGGMGEFDSQFATAVRLCKIYNKDVKLILVKPYFSNELNVNKEYYEYYYDDIFIPEELADSHYKAAITKRNRWMIDQSQIILSGVYRDFGGAYETIKYAQKTDKRVITIKE